VRAAPGSTCAREPHGSSFCLIMIMQLSVVTTIHICLLGIVLLWPYPAESAPRPTVEAANGIVVSAHRLASEAGIAMLQQGGNAIDAAVAVGYAEAVVDPCCGNIGGGGFLVAHLADGRGIFLNFRETAPSAATHDMYLDAQGNVARAANLYGWRAVAVPGTVMGLDAASAKYGTLPRSIVMAPAIRLAREGFEFTRYDTDILQRGTALFRRDGNAARIFLHPDGSPLQPGEQLVQPQLAATLASIAANGVRAFYSGRIPDFETASRTGNGIITAADFAAYHVTLSEPLSCTYRGYVFLSAPPPSSGGVTLCEILHVLEGYDLRALGFYSAQTVHVIVEAMRHAYFDRNTYLGDPDFVTNPLAKLLSSDYAAAIRAHIGDRATPSDTLPLGIEPHEQMETTHYSVMDRAGNAVAVTYTLNGRFGAGVMAGDTGFFLNDEMDDFTVKRGVPNLFGLVQGEANAIAPGKRPLSSMTPTVVLRDGRVFLVLGSPGGPRIITVILETALNILDYGMAPQAAVDLPHLHHQWLLDEIFVERSGLSSDTRALLQDMGYRIREQASWGATELIEAGPPRATADATSSVSDRMRPGFYYGASDLRRPAGSAIGY
jgi:gamma-glutamyltranspeptidase / glutathione hydrolase